MTVQERGESEAPGVGVAIVQRGVDFGVVAVIQSAPIGNLGQQPAHRVAQHGQAQGAGGRVATDRLVVVDDIRAIERGNPALAQQVGEAGDIEGRLAAVERGAVAVRHPLHRPATVVVDLLVQPGAQARSAAFVQVVEIHPGRAIGGSGCSVRGHAAPSNDGSCGPAAPIVTACCILCVWARRRPLARFAPMYQSEGCSRVRCHCATMAWRMASGCQPVSAASVAFSACQRAVSAWR
jgi:hypothetical protein